MNQNQITIQHMRIARVVNSAHIDVTSGAINETEFNRKLATVAMARKTVRAAQYRLDTKGY